jgi:hypothetical protein
MRSHLGLMPPFLMGAVAPGDLVADGGFNQATAAVQVYTRLTALTVALESLPQGLKELRLSQDQRDGMEAVSRRRAFELVWLSR